MLQFALIVSDPSGCVQVLLHGAEAERYLETTPQALQADPLVREEVHRRLAALRDQHVHAEFKVRVFVDKEVLPLPGQEAPAPPAKRTRGNNNNNNNNGSNNRREQQEQQQITYVR